MLDERKGVRRGSMETRGEDEEEQELLLLETGRTTVTVRASNRSGAVSEGQPLWSTAKRRGRSSSLRGGLLLLVLLLLPNSFGRPTDDARDAGGGD